jgi:4-hydroxybenzoate polyprenyltransferase/phosphoserine phosphatase
LESELTAEIPNAVASSGSSRSSGSTVPLCVDLDGTLVKSDTLWDSLLVLVRSHPGKLTRLPAWLAGGKASFKEHVASVVTLDVAHLPYNRALLGFLQQEHAGGRRIYLATGADDRLARCVAEHPGIFEDVIASDGHTNLTGDDKLASLESRFGSFDYVGNARPDLPLLRQAREAMVANPHRSLLRQMRAGGVVTQREFLDRRPPARAALKVMRVHQWSKNLLVFLPLALSHTLRSGPWLRTVLAFACFSACASAAYIVNDLLDLESDRRHPRKRSRPFAAGDLAVPAGLILAAGLFAAGFVGTVWLPAGVAAWLALYVATTLAYSLYLKRIAIVDVLVLSGLYALRLLAGGAAAGVPISPWLTAFAIFLFLSLATVKRFSELRNLRDAGSHPRNGRGYLLDDLEQLRSFGTSSAYAAVIVFALYISSRDVMTLYRHPHRMWFVLPLMIWWLNRIWLLASRGLLDEDPLIFALTDRVSLLLGAMIVVIALAAI